MTKLINPWVPHHVANVEIIGTHDQFNQRIGYIRSYFDPTAVKAVAREALIAAGVPQTDIGTADCSPRPTDAMDTDRLAPVKMQLLDELRGITRHGWQGTAQLVRMQYEDGTVPTSGTPNIQIVCTFDGPRKNEVPVNLESATRTNSLSEFSAPIHYQDMDPGQTDPKLSNLRWPNLPL